MQQTGSFELSETPVAHNQKDRQRGGLSEIRPINDVPQSKAPFSDADK